MQKQIIFLVIVLMSIVPSVLLAQVVQYQTVHNELVNDTIPPTVTISLDKQLQKKCLSDCNHVAYRLVRQLNCGATVAIEDVLSDKPTCKMVPRVSTSGAVMLEWDTKRATVAFIDLGVGHVDPKGGARIVTPTQDTTYNMTVLDKNGLVGVCSAQINISNVNAQTHNLLVLGNRATQDTQSANDVQDNGTYSYNENAVNNNVARNTQDEEALHNKEGLYVDTVNTNKIVEKKSFFTSGTFLFFALLFVFVIALWLIVRHGVR